MAQNRQLKRAWQDQADISRSVTGPYQYTNITANGTYTIFTGPGILHSITVNTTGAGGNQIIVSDSSSGSLPGVAKITPSTSSPNFFQYDVQVMTGLTIQMINGTPADITVAWG